MAEVTVTVNGRPYAVGCEDGQEQHVLGLAAMFDQHVSQVARDVGQEQRAQQEQAGIAELADTRGNLSGSSGEMSRLHAERLRIESRAVAVLEAAAGKIEALAAKTS